jgi:hypothetical protein
VKKPSRGAMVASGVGLVAATSLIVAQKRRHASHRESAQAPYPAPEPEVMAQASVERGPSEMERMEPIPEE